MRFLTTLVVGLGVLIVAAAGLLAWGLFSRARVADTPPSAASVAVNLNLPEGCAVKSAAAAGENVLVHVQGAGAAGSCDKVLIVDWARGRVLGTIEARGTPQGFSKQSLDKEDPRKP